MAYIRESTIEKYLVTEVKSLTASPTSFYLPVAVQCRIGWFCYLVAGQSSLSAKPPARNHGPSSCANMNGLGRWALP